VPDRFNRRLRRKRDLPGCRPGFARLLANELRIRAREPSGGDVALGRREGGSRVLNPTALYFGLKKDGRPKIAVRFAATEVSTMTSRPGPTWRPRDEIGSADCYTSVTGAAA